MQPGCLRELLHPAVSRMAPSTEGWAGRSIKSWLGRMDQGSAALGMGGGQQPFGK